MLFRLVLKWRVLKLYRDYKYMEGHTDLFFYAGIIKRQNQLLEQVRRYRLLETVPIEQALLYSTILNAIIPDYLSMLDYAKGTSILDGPEKKRFADLIEQTAIDRVRQTMDYLLSLVG